MIDGPTLVSALGIIGGFGIPLIKMFTGWILDLRNLNKTQQDNIDNLTKDLLEEKKSRLEADVKAQEFERDITNLEQDRELREKEYAAQTLQNEQFKKAMQEQIDSLYDRIGSEQRANAEKFKEQQAKIDSQSDKIRTLNSQVETLNEDLAEARVQYVTLDKLHQELKGKSESQARVIEHKDEQLKAYARLVEERDQHIAQVELEKKKMADENKALIERVQAIEAKLEAVAQLRAQITLLSAQVAQLIAKQAVEVVEEASE